MNGDFWGCRGDGGTDCHSQCAHWLRNDTLQGVQWAGDRKGRPYESVTRGAAGRADVGIGPYGYIIVSTVEVRAG